MTAQSVPLRCRRQRSHFRMQRCLGELTCTSGVVPAGAVYVHGYLRLCAVTY
jgi:hypothetical protein